MAHREGYVIIEETQIATIVKIMAAIIMCWCHTGGCCI